MGYEFKNVLYFFYLVPKVNDAEYDTKYFCLVIKRDNIINRHSTEAHCLLKF